MAPWPEKVFAFPFYCPTSIKFAFHYQYMADDTYIMVSDVRDRLMQPLMCLAKHRPLKMLGA